MRPPSLGHIGPSASCSLYVSFPSLSLSMNKFMETRGFEPLTLGLQSRCSIMQCYHYMAVTGRRAWYIAVAILGKEFLFRKLVWDGELIRQMVEAEERFWMGYVMKGAN